MLSINRGVASPSVAEDADDDKEDEGDEEKEAKEEKEGLKEERQPQTLFSGKLRNYQCAGVDWILSLYENSKNGILADEMGLGKTVQVIALLCTLWEKYKIRGPHLIVVPLSVMSSWGKDILSFCADSIDVYIHHGEKKSRHKLFQAWRTRELGLSKKTYHNISKGSKISVVLTTFEMVIKDCCIFQQFSQDLLMWHYFVIDEAHRIKNDKSLVFNKLNGIISQNRLLLTGTPLQNNISELWSLLSFILPDMFNEQRDFSYWLTTFGSETQPTYDWNCINHLNHSINSSMVECETTVDECIIKKCYMKSRILNDVDEISLSPGCELLLSDEQKDIVVSQLHGILKPFILRRLKSEVALDVPPRLERNLYCPQSALQREIHIRIKHILESQDEEHESNELDEERENYYCDNFIPTHEYRINPLLMRRKLNFNNVVMLLRKLCNHPYLVLEDMMPIPNELYCKHLLPSCGKLTVLDRLLKILLPRGHKILIFSQMTTMLDIIQDYISSLGLGIGCLRLDGSTNATDRQSQVDAFKEEGSSNSHREHGAKVKYPIFLLSTRAGGVGINLQSADIVILYDSDWNPQQDLQALSRAHRIGQAKEVLVFRLITAGFIPGDVGNGSPGSNKIASIEERIIRKANEKLDTERRVLKSGIFDLGISSQSKDLKKDLKKELQHTGGNQSSLHCLNLSSLFNAEVERVDQLLDSSIQNSSSVIPAVDACCHEILSSLKLDEMCDKGFEDGDPEGDGTSCSLDDWKDWLDFIPSKNSSSSRKSKISLENIETKELKRKKKIKVDICYDEYLGWNQEYTPMLTKSSESAKKKSRKQGNKQRDFSGNERASAVLDGSTCRARNNAKADDTMHNNDICQLCKKRLLSKSDIQSLSTIEAHAPNAIMISGGERIEIKTTSLRNDSTMIDSVEGLHISTNKKLYTKMFEMRDLLIICDSCEGTFHALCVGITDIPEGDWFCRWCQDDN